MGGPQSVYEELRFPWLVSEKKFIYETITLRKPVLGFCLGSQLIASSLGSRVFANNEKEIGWFPIHFTTSSQRIPWLKVQNQEIVFHWHGDTFDLPEQAVLLASSDLTQNQAFLWGDRVLGLQFHLEVDQKSLENFIHNDPGELKGIGHVQSVNEVRTHLNQAYRCREILNNILIQWEYLSLNP